MPAPRAEAGPACARPIVDRKSTRLNSSHANISYAVFCLKKQIVIHCDHNLLSPTAAAGLLFRAAHFQRRLVQAGRRFFFNDTATTEIYTLSLHDALPI